ncbi:MAG: 2-oxo acid dehydrogenase subunit E2 [Archangium sp.]|nr:2-oxo acid dehydrogenase subunit E2 [Archangium sp.]
MTQVMRDNTHMPATFQSLPDASSFRRTAASMWSAPKDPSIHGSMDVDATHALAFLEAHRARTGEKLTMTHLVCAATARALAKHPDLNAKVRFGGRLEKRSTVDLFVSVSTGNGKDLSGAKIERADALDWSGWTEAIGGRAKQIREGKDPAFEKSRSLFKALPFFLLRPLLWLVDVLTNELHLHLPSQGMPRDPFGSAVITNVGMFGIDTAFAPFVPLGRCPMLLLITEVKDRPWVEEGKLVVKPVLRLCATFDHRIIDGYAAGLLAKEIRAQLEQPLPAQAAAAEAA